MRALDTNVIARVILGDDDIQTPSATALFDEPVWISMTVWLELGWVLGKRLALDRRIVADAMDAILSSETVHTPDSAGLAWALERYRAGADWADMLHLLSARGVADCFTTFDRAIPGQAGGNPPLSIETLS